MPTLVRITDNQVEVVHTASTTLYAVNPPADMTVNERVQLLARNLPGHTASIWNRHPITLEAKADRFSTLMVGVILARAVHVKVTSAPLADLGEANGE